MTLNHLFSKLKGSSSSGNYGHAGRPGKRGGSSSVLGVVNTRKDLETINDGIYSVYAELPGKNWNFHDKFLVGIHNSNRGKERLRKYASDNPQDYQKYKNAMLFQMWKDSNSSLPLNEFSNNPLRVYRGGFSDKVDNNASYTTDKRIAKSFAEYGASSDELGFREKLDVPGQIYEKEILPKDILYYSNAQGELELVLK